MRLTKNARRKQKLNNSIKGGSKRKRNGNNSNPAKLKSFQSANLAAQNENFVPIRWNKVLHPLNTQQNENERMHVEKLISEEEDRAAAAARVAAEAARAAAAARVAAEAARVAAEARAEVEAANKTSCNGPTCSIMGGATRKKIKRSNIRVR